MAARRRRATGPASSSPFRPRPPSGGPATARGTRSTSPGSSVSWSRSCGATTAACGCRGGPRSPSRPVWRTGAPSPRWSTRSWCPPSGPTTPSAGPSSRSTSTSSSSARSSTRTRWPRGGSPSEGGPSCSARPRSWAPRRVARSPAGRWPTRCRAACVGVAVLRVQAGASLRCPPVPTTRTLSEAASKALLAAHGVPIAQERIVADAAAAGAAADELGFPVVVKLNGDRHRPQDRAGAGAPQPRHPGRGRAGRRRPAGGGRPGRRRGRAAGGADGAGQPGAHRRAQPGPPVRHDRDARRRRDPGRGPGRRRVPPRAARAGGRPGHGRPAPDAGAPRCVPRRACRRPGAAGRRARRAVAAPPRPMPPSCRPTSTR